MIKKNILITGAGGVGTYSILKFSKGDIVVIVVVTEDTWFNNKDVDDIYSNIITILMFW